MTTEELIVRLAASARPVQPLPSPARRLGRSVAAAVALVVVGVAIFGTRPDVAYASSRILFVAAAGLTLATALIAAAAAFVLSVPGIERSAIERWAAVAGLAAWAGLLSLSLASGGSAIQRVAAFPVHLGCIAQIVALAIVPVALLVTMLRRAAPLRSNWSTGLATLAAATLAAFGVQFICPIDDPAHQLVGHLVPVAALALVGAFAGSRLLTQHLPIATR